MNGGIKKRGGTSLVKAVAGAVRLIPFVVSHRDTYILVFKPNSIDVINSEGVSVTTIATTYSSIQIKELTYCQSRYNLWLAHGDKPLSWLRCSEDFTNWDFSAFIYSIPPLEEVSNYPVVLNMSEDVKDVGKVTTLEVQAYETYLATKQYYVDDIVKSGTSYYKCLVDHINQPLSDPTYWTLITVEEANVFSASSVGKFVFANGGIVRIDTYLSATRVEGEIIKKLTSTIEVVARAWQIKENIFTANLGYPRTVSYYQQRLVLGGTKKYPNYIWFSRTADFTNFLPTTEDGDSFTLAAASDSLTNVLHLSQSRGVVVHTGGAELLIKSTGALTPTSAEIQEHTSYGTIESIKPVKVGTELIFIQRGSRVRTLAYDYSVDGLVSNELSVLASHIIKDHGGLKDMVYAQDPDSIIWFTLGDGTLATLTLNREQSVTAWARHDVGGEVISLTTLPSTTGSDRVYLLVNRNGSLQIEEIKEELLLDTAKLVNVSHSTTCTVTDSLIGVLGDKVQAYFKDGNTVFEVPILSRAGNTLIISCDPSINQIYIGRAFTSAISLLPTDFQQIPGTTFPSLIKVDHITLALKDSIAPVVNGDRVETNTFDMNLMLPPQLYTGMKRIAMNGWTSFEEFEITIEQDRPLPLQIIACVLEQSVNDR